jgi:hypothetical protein
MMVYRRHHDGFFPFANFPAESRLKGHLSAIAIYTQVVTSRLKAERRGKKSTCVGGGESRAQGIGLVISNAGFSCKRREEWVKSRSSWHFLSLKFKQTHCFSYLCRNYFKKRN